MTSCIYFLLSGKEEATRKTFKAKRSNWGTRRQTQEQKGKREDRRKWVETSHQIQDKDVPIGGGRMRDITTSVRRTLHSRAEQGYT